MGRDSIPLADFQIGLCDPAESQYAFVGRFNTAAIIQLSDVPEHVYSRLVEQAKKEHRSLSQQAVAVLARSLRIDDDKARRREILRAIESRGRVGTGRLSDPVKLIREDRRR